ncbi:MAG: hypothetical protein DI537_05275 [Stutzerimonas stutzeri]|nr:MAG: hypothetical protein DI537_05275 [Stutzerimonas stutzeri]
MKPLEVNSSTPAKCDAENLSYDLLTIVRAKKLVPADWTGPVCHDGQIYMSLGVMLHAFRLSMIKPPDHVHAARASQVAADAEGILAHIFPDGLPRFESIPKETSVALHALIAAAHKVAKSPGMQRLVPDRDVIIVLDEDRFNKKVVAGLKELEL